MWEDGEGAMDGFLDLLQTPWGRREDLCMNKDNPIMKSLGEGFSPGEIEARLIKKIDSFTVLSDSLYTHGYVEGLRWVLDHLIKRPFQQN